MAKTIESCFLSLNLVRLYPLYKILYPKRRIESYSILGTIVSPNKILLNRSFTLQLEYLQNNSGAQESGFEASGLRV